VNKIDLAYEIIIMGYKIHGETVTRDSPGITRAAVRLKNGHRLASLQRIYANVKKQLEIKERIKTL